MSFLGLAPYDMNMLFVAIPAAGFAVIVAIIGWSAAGDLLLPRPVLVVSDEGLFDRRVSDDPIRWEDVNAATSLLEGKGGVVLELAPPVETRLDPYRPGTFMFERPEPGVAHIAVRAMTISASRLARAILEVASAHGVDVRAARTHERMRRRRWMG